MLTRLMQYLLPLRSGRLCPRWVPVRETVSPFLRARTASQLTSWSLNDGHPCDKLSSLQSSKDLPTGALNNSAPDRPIRNDDDIDDGLVG